MTLTEAYEAIIKLSHPEKLKQPGNWCHGCGGEPSINRHNELESEPLPMVRQDPLPGRESEIN
jgi:hypothetical protein